MAGFSLASSKDWILAVPKCLGRTGRQYEVHFCGSTSTVESELVRVRVAEHAKVSCVRFGESLLKATAHCFPSSGNILDD